MSPSRSEIDVDKIVQTIREEVRRQTAALSPERSHPPLEPLPNPVSTDLVRRLQGLTLTLENRASKLGTPTAEVMTVRGRLASRLMRVMSRALWWYSYHLQNFASAIVHLQREQTKTLEALARSGQLLQNTIGEASATIARLEQEVREVRAQIEETGAKYEGFKRRTEAQLAALPSMGDHPELAKHYASFEDVFRGSREMIKERQAVYLPLLNENGIGSSAMPILDLGCGRGEWLELLRENTMDARGVDSNEQMASRCLALNLSVILSDAGQYLRSLPPATLGAVTAFHLVEHLPFEVVLHILAESLRALKPGGLLIFETPNPENIQVGSHTFYLDPTHIRPLPPGMLSFFVRASGFRDVQTRMLHPYEESAKLPGESKFDRYFYGPQDYAVIGKAG